ncbi:MAG: hypothetical protein ACRERU_18085 [Methylococcales bacterium]
MSSEVVFSRKTAQISSTMPEQAGHDGLSFSADFAVGAQLFKIGF